MAGSKNTFTTKSRFSQLSYSRKAAAAVVLLLLGLGIADPGFLAGDSFEGHYDVSSEDDVESLLAKMNGRADGSESADHELTSESDDTSANLTLTIPDSGASTSSMQSVSYPKSSESTASEVNQDVAHVSLPGASLPSSGHSESGYSSGESRSSPVSIRFMGTIYPTN